MSNPALSSAITEKLGDLAELMKLDGELRLFLAVVGSGETVHTMHTFTSRAELETMLAKMLRRVRSGAHERYRVQQGGGEGEAV